jgi:hypothetical protein
MKANIPTRERFSPGLSRRRVRPELVLGVSVVAAEDMGASRRDQMRHHRI